MSNWTRYNAGLWSDPRHGTSAEELIRSFASSTAGSAPSYQTHSHIQSYSAQWQVSFPPVYTSEDLEKMQKDIDEMMGTIKAVRKDSRMKCITEKNYGK